MKWLFKLNFDQLRVSVFLTREVKALSDLPGHVLMQWLATESRVDRRREKPMYWRTFERLQAKLDKHEEQSLVRFMARFKIGV